METENIGLNERERNPEEDKEEKTVEETEFLDNLDDPVERLRLMKSYLDVDDKEAEDEDTTVEPVDVDLEPEEDLHNQSIQPRLGLLLGLEIL